MNVLIVDDSDDGRQVLRYMTERYGHTVVEAWNGEDALEKVRSHVPDLIISDVLMPRLDGFQFLRALKMDASSSSIPFIFYSSSYRESQDIQLAMSLGADAYILKPVEPEDLWARIEGILGDRSQCGPASTSLADDDAEYLRQYSNLLATKLEEKVQTLERTLEERRRAEIALCESESRLRDLFEDSPISIWEEDFSELKRRIDEAKAGGVRDWNVFFGSRERVSEYVSLVKVIDVNRATLQLFEYGNKSEIIGSLQKVFDIGSLGAFRDEIVALASGHVHFECESENSAKSGRRVFVLLRLSVVPGFEESWSRILVSLVDMTEYRNTERALQESEAKYRGLVEQASEGIILLDGEGTLKDCNPFFERLAGDEKRRLLGGKVWEARFRHLVGEGLPETRYVSAVENWKTAIRGGLPASPAGPFEAVVESAKGERLIVELTLYPISMRSGFMVGGIIRDVTMQRVASDALSASLREKEVLLKEIHHRVKNNLQIICSLINLQLLDADGSGPADRALVDMESRVMSMSLVHELLYESPDFSHIDFSGYIRQLCDHLFSTYIEDPGRIKLEMAVQDISLALDKAIPCGLLINELVANSLSHSFPDKRSGTVRIEMLMREGGSISLVVSDDGIGAMKPTRDGRPHRAIGLALVDSLAQQLDGECVSEEKEGMSVSVVFPA